MQKSESIKSLAQALITFHVKVEKIKKDGNNPFFKSKYATLSNILDAINDPLIESGLSFSQLPTGENGLLTILMHGESGEFISSVYDMRPVKDDPQGRGSVITYQRRYALAAILGLNIDDDDDANHATFGGSTPEKAQQNISELPWLNKDTKQGTLTDDWKNVTSALKSGKYGINDVLKKFKLSKTVRAELDAIINEGVMN